MAANFKFPVGHSGTLTANFFDNSVPPKLVTLHTPAVWFVADPTVISVSSSGMNTAAFTCLKTDPITGELDVNITATAIADVWNTGFTGSTTGGVVPFTITIFSCTISAS